MKNSVSALYLLYRWVDMLANLKTFSAFFLIALFTALVIRFILSLGIR